MKRDINLTAGMWQKTQEKQTYEFPGMAYPFIVKPIVLVSPVWRNPGSSLAYVPTISGTTITDTTIVSSNHAPEDYYVNVIAIELHSRDSEDEMLVSQSSHKNLRDLDIKFARPFNNESPVTLVSPNWIDTTRSVSGIETINTMSAEKIQVVSVNRGRSYYVNNVSLGSGVFVAKGGQQVEVNRVNKTSSGVCRVYFSQSYAQAPVVVASPYWDGANRSVNFVEIITNVTSEWFEIQSGNAGNNYFVNWMAVGKAV